MTRIPRADWSTKDEAHRLAAKIRAYWADQGEDVSVWVETLVHGTDQYFYVIRSDMINGLPRPTHLRKAA